MNEQDLYSKCNQIIDWFVRNHNEWVKENKLVSWAERLGIKLIHNNTLDENSLFHLFVLGVLWNSRPTYRTQKGEEVFRKIKDTYTLTKFRDAYSNEETRKRLIQTARDEIGNEGIFNVLNFIANGSIDNVQIWPEINSILTSENSSYKDFDVSRLKRLYYLINPPNRKRNYDGNAYLTKKVFLIFREIRIQFRESGNFQYHPSICCVPDSHVQQALIKLGILDKQQNQIEGLLKVSEIVSEYFCEFPYELYDLPLFFANKENFLQNILQLKSEEEVASKQDFVESAGICPMCGSKLVWRKARKTGERYRGCTNFQRGCRWNDRSY